MSFKGSPVITGLFILMLTACTSNYQKLSTKPVAKVNEHVFTTKEFANQLARKLKNFDALAAKDPGNVARTKEDLIRQFVVKSLTLDWARANNIFITEKALDTEVDKLRANYPDDLSFRRSLALENLSFSEWREDLRYVLIEREVFKKINEKIKAPADEEVRSYYDSHKDQYKRKERVFLRQVLVDDEARADLMKTQLKNKDFAEVAKKYSMAPEGKNGGLIGWIEAGSVDFFDPLFKAPMNSVQTIHSPFGFHLVRVEKKQGASILPMEEVKPQIIRALRAQREQGDYVAWLDAQLRSSKVYKDYDLMNALTVDTRGENE
jgi:peptidyl-prolyl cis-trans isomerase C